MKAASVSVEGYRGPALPDSGKGGPTVKWQVACSVYLDDVAPGGPPPKPSSSAPRARISRLINSALSPSLSKLAQKQGQKCASELS